MANSYRDLTVWQKSVELACDVHRLTKLMPTSERYGLSSQIIQAAASVPANIAEGNGRGTRKDYANFISIARGSAAELETFLIIIGKLELAPRETVAGLLERAQEVSRMLNALRQRLTASSNLVSSS